MANTFYSAFDEERLSPAAAPAGDTRSAFETDRDRIIHSSAFRRLQSKTQVFLSGEYDFYRTRLTHSIEVAQIGRSICRHLERTSPLLGPDFHIDADLVEAVCLAHDLGHPPFGHTGERALNRLMAAYGGFEGNAQTLRLVSGTLYQGTRGMNPTRAFADGILKYKTLRGELPAEPPPENHFLYDDQASVLDFAMGGRDFPAELTPGDTRNAFRSIECQIMDWADDTAYSLHDLIDGIHAGFLTRTSIEKWASGLTDSHETAAIEYLLAAIADGKVESRLERRIGAFIRATTLEQTSCFLSPPTHRHAFRLVIDPAAAVECATFKRLALEQVFLSHQLKQLEYKGERMLTEMFRIIAGQYLERSSPRFQLLPPASAEMIAAAQDIATRARLLCDYLAGMSDGFAARTYKRLTDPDFGSIVDLV